MSATIPQQAAPIGNNVVPFPPAPGGGPMPNMIPNPAFAQWQQQAQQVRAVMAQNQQKQAQFDAAVALLKKDGIHGFKLDIEADSTIAPDEQAEKQARIEFLQQMLPMLERVIPVAQGNPPLAALSKEMVMFAARGFRVARTLEETIEKTFDAIGQMPPTPPKGSAAQHAAPPDPQLEQAKVAATMHDTDQKAQTARLAIAQKADQAQTEAQIAQTRAQAEDMKTQAELAIQVGELHQRERIAASRATAVDARSAGGLA